MFFRTLSCYHAGITSFQITLDGWNHDKTRPHVSGKGTLKKIIENLVALSALPPEEYQYSIILRHNILSDDEDFGWYDYLYELFGKDKRFCVVIRAVCDWGGESVHGLPLLKGEAMQAMMDRHVAYLAEIGLQCYNLKQTAFSNVCNAAYPHSMVFRSDGKIEKCTICLDQPLNQIGRVDPDDGVILKQDAVRMWSNNSLQPECYRCTKILSCLNTRCKRSQLIDRKTDTQCPLRSVRDEMETVK